jgi:OmpR-family two-component system manganese-sensing response regulator
MQVLLVEDDVDISTAIAGLLEVEGYLPTVVATVEGARKAMSEHVFEVALLDWMLREETSEALLDDLEAQRVPTVFYSANDGARAIANRWGLDFVTKPFDIEELLEAVETTRTNRRTPHKI